MNIDENMIRKLDREELVDEDFLLSLIEIEDELDRARMIALAEFRAISLGAKAPFKQALRAYLKANEALQAKNKKMSAKKQNFELAVDGNGRPLATIDNFLKVIENDEYFAGLKFNLLSYSPEKETDGEVKRWTDADDAEARHYIETKYGFHSVQKCDDALRIVFAKNEYHPIQKLVDTFEWDGTRRIEGFLHKWTKCEDTPYTREVSRLIFAGGIHRLYLAGCKFDDVPVLIGTNQGEGKSTLVRWLALSDDYFNEVVEFEGQKGIESVEGAWICEVGEMLALTKAKEQEAVKSFLTRQNDRYRMPFDKRVTDHPRQCIFIGTTNRESFLLDKTGNRRFYPVKVNQTGYELYQHEKEIKADIVQCWAEARYRCFFENMTAFLDRSLIDVVRQEQRAAVEEDFREGLIAEYLNDPTKIETCVLDLWENALKMGMFSKPTKKDSVEIGLIMQNMKDWEREKTTRRIEKYGTQRCWRRKIDNACSENIEAYINNLFEF